MPRSSGESEKILADYNTLFAELLKVLEEEDYERSIVILSQIDDLIISLVELCKKESSSDEQLFIMQLQKLFMLHQKNTSRIEVWRVEVEKMLRGMNNRIKLYKSY
ncbi:hypothetical protein NT239_00260 [Chitinibacter sp. SCUT-21]|uniref:hypothetical protein n=1 Tax=Chitinibacter sp. SCUT-21 TaxID=2970891 RepID=UPI0035A74034